MVWSGHRHRPGRAGLCLPEPTQGLREGNHKVQLRDHREQIDMKAILQTIRPCRLMGTLAVFSGCGTGATAHPADPAQAHEALRTVLDAWKAGEKPQDLVKRTPPIQVLDLDWQGGFTLIGYKADAEGKLVG